MTAKFGLPWATLGMCSLLILNNVECTALVCGPAPVGMPPPMLVGMLPARKLTTTSGSIFEVKRRFDLGSVPPNWGLLHIQPTFG